MKCSESSNAHRSCTIQREMHSERPAGNRVFSSGVDNAHSGACKKLHLHGHHLGHKVNVCRADGSCLHFMPHATTGDLHSSEHSLMKDCPAVGNSLSQDVSLPGTVHSSVRRKKCVANCGVQVNIKRRTVRKETQVSDTDFFNTNSCTVCRGGTGDELHLCSVSHCSVCPFKTCSWALSPCSQSIKKTPCVHTDCGIHHSSCQLPCHGKQHQMLQGLRSLSSDENNDSIPQLTHLAYLSYQTMIHLERCPNGGGMVVHAYHNDLLGLSKWQKEEFAKQFLDIVFREDNGYYRCVMGIVHNAASTMDDFFRYFCKRYPQMNVKVGILGRSDIVSTSMQTYEENIVNSYCYGTFRWGPLLQMSLVGAVQEEVCCENLSLCLISVELRRTHSFLSISVFYLPMNFLFYNVYGMFTSDISDIVYICIVNTFILD